MKRKPEETSEKDRNKMNRTACCAIRSYLTQDIKYHVMIETSTKKIWEILVGRYLTKSIENRLPSEEEALSLLIEERYLDQ